MSWHLSLSERGSGLVADRLRGLGASLRDPAPFFDAVEEILFDASRARWRANGYGWRPLDPSTIRRKARSRDAATKANASRILRATGALERALTEKGAPGQKLEHERDSLAFGIYVGGERGREVWYGQIAQAGKGEARRTILKKTPAMQRRVNEALREHLGLEG